MEVVPFVTRHFSSGQRVWLAPGTYWGTGKREVSFHCGLPGINSFIKYSSHSYAALTAGKSLPGIIEDLWFLASVGCSVAPW